MKLVNLMKHWYHLVLRAFGSRKEETVDLTSYLMGGHISKTTGKRYRKK